MVAVLIVQIIFLFVIFIVTLLSVILPIKLLPRDNEQTLGTTRTRIISLCNCLSGGVFIGTCFIQLIPYIEVKLEKVLDEVWEEINTEYAGLFTQTAVVMGFIGIVLVEQCVKKCQEGHREYTSLHDSSNGSTVPLCNGTIETDYSTQSTNDAHILLESASQTRQSKYSYSTSADSEQVNSQSHDGHGHSHIADIIHNDFGIRCMLLLAALSIHSVFEGLAMGLQYDMDQLVNLFIGILAHEILVSFSMGVSLAKQRLSVTTLVKICTVYSAMIPIGMAIGMGIGDIHTFAGNLTSAIVQGITAGTFVYVIFLEILPTELNDERDKLWKILFIFIGFACIFCLRITLKSEH